MDSKKLWLRHAENRLLSRGLRRTRTLVLEGPSFWLGLSTLLLLLSAASAGAQTTDCCQDGIKIQYMEVAFQHPLVSTASSIDVAVSKNCGGTPVEAETYGGVAPVNDNYASNTLVHDLAIASVDGDTMVLTVEHGTRLRPTASYEITFDTGETVLGCVHTSCSQPIYAGLEFGDYFTVTELGGLGMVADCVTTLAVCGDGTVEGDEECDDGNTDPGDGCDETCVGEAPADVSVSLTDHLDPILAGDILTYPVTVGNNGPGDAANVVVTVSLDPNTTFIDSTIPCAENQSGVATCELGAVVASQAIEFEIDVEVAGDTPSHGTLGVGDCDGSEDLCAAAEVTTTSPDSNPDNNADDEPTDVVICGNGIPEVAEACDDGNDSNNDACLSDCSAASCGDGQLHDGVEACDDGNGSNTDACLNDCSAASCGDGNVRDGVEACDDGNDSNTDACLNDCTPASCGDGHLQASVEECDDGGAVPGDGCDETCGIEPTTTTTETTTTTTTTSTTTTTLAICGNGVVEGSEECDDANVEDDDGCDSSCRIEEPASVAAYVWYDVNANGVQNAGELPVANVPVDLHDAAGSGGSAVVATVATANDGWVSFSNVTPGSYYLSFSPPPEYQPSPQDSVEDDGVDSDVDPVTLTTPIRRVRAGQIVDDIALGLHRCGNGAVDPGEGCDDGNNDDSDGCSAGCLRESDVDLTVVVSDSPDAVLAGNLLAYPVRVTNTGSGDAFNVVVTDTLDINTAFVAATASCVEGAVGVSTCDLGTLGAGESVDFEITVEVDIAAPTAGDLQSGPCDGSEDLCNSVCVSTTSNDTDPGNDCDDEPTDVLDPGPAGTGICGNGILEAGEQCDPPSAEDCANGFDDDGDGLVDCADANCWTGLPTCGSTCEEVQSCQPLLEDPQLIRFGKRGKPDLFKMHARFNPLSEVDLSTETVSFIVSNVNGVVYRGTLFPEDFTVRRNGIHVFKDKAARKGQGSRSGIGIFYIIPRKEPGTGVLTYAFKTKIFSDMSRATLATMTTQVNYGNDVGALTATWLGEYGRYWKLREKDIIEQGIPQ